MNRQHVTEARQRLPKQPLPMLYSEPVVAQPDQVAGGAWTPARRRDLWQQWRRGELTELGFDAVVYRTGPNANHVRFREEELPGFAASFAGQPFLRNHADNDIGARDGTIVASRLVGDEIHQSIRLTTQRGIGSFLEGVIDRFSIGWRYADVQCSVCEGPWLACEHWPGRSYRVGNGATVLCELIFWGPVGKETSAVNAPAVPGTRILATLCSLKESSLKEATMMEQESPRHAAQLSRVRTGAVDAQPVGVLYLPGGGVYPVSSPVAVETAPAVDVSAPIAASGATVAPARIGSPPAEVRGIRPVTAGDMTTPEERLQGALNWLFGAQGEATPPPGLRNLPELYVAITGDSEWHGVFRPEWSRLSTASTSTLAGMVVNALNKVVRLHYENLATYRWYEQIVDVVPHDGTTHDVQLILVDGLANLPTVGEGAAYTEATVGDSKESFTFTKRGHYVGITLEAIRRGNLQRIQAIPRELVKAAIRTRSAAIAGLFTQAGGVGPTLADDNTPLFHTNHGNLGTGALGPTEWAAARKRIWQQVVPGTGSPLALWPTFCLVPIHLYDSALEIFGYGSGDVGKPNTGGTAQTPNPYGQSRAGDPRPIPVAVPEWTDATDWAYLVDPRLHPVIHMAYAGAPQGNSHPLPEIFEVTGESHGLMFTNDTLPVKIRDWWGYGVSTYVGIGKNNVTG